MKFLVVDDSPTMRRIVCNALREIGYSELTEAEDGNDALEKLSDDPVDFVITDWNMPNMNGLQLTQAIRQHPEYGTLPILMVTGLDDDDAIDMAFSAGATDFATKPINWAVMVFFEYVSPSYNDMGWPVTAPPALRGLQVREPDNWICTSSSSNWWYGEYPSSMAAAYTNGLNVEPGCR